MFHIFERRNQPLIPRERYHKRVARYGLIALFIVLGALLLGVVGYKVTERMSWLDALLNASMILGGMGEVSELHTVGGKLFASFYAIFSGVVFLFSFSIFLAPIVHRFLHHFHIEVTDEPETDS